MKVKVIGGKGMWINGKFYKAGTKDDTFETDERHAKELVQMFPDRYKLADSTRITTGGDK